MLQSAPCGSAGTEPPENDVEVQKCVETTSGTWLHPEAGGSPVLLSAQLEARGSLKDQLSWQS